MSIKYYHWIGKALCSLPSNRTIRNSFCGLPIPSVKPSCGCKLLIIYTSTKILVDFVEVHTHARNQCLDVDGSTCPKSKRQTHVYVLLEYISNSMYVFYFIYLLHIKSVYIYKLFILFLKEVTKLYMKNYKFYDFYIKILLKSCKICQSSDITKL